MMSTLLTAAVTDARLLTPPSSSVACTSTLKLPSWSYRCVTRKLVVPADRVTNCGAEPSPQLIVSVNVSRGLGSVNSPINAASLRSRAGAIDTADNVGATLLTCTLVDAETDGPDVVKYSADESN